MKKELAVLALSGALLCSLSVPAFAGEDVCSYPTADQMKTTTQAPAQTPTTALYAGIVKELVREEGKLTQVILQAEGQQEQIAMVITEDTMWVDGGKSSTAVPGDLREGEAIFAVHSVFSTRSIPAQSAAYALVRHMAQEGVAVEPTSSAYNSCLTTGVVKELVQEEGKTTQLLLENAEGEYAMNLSEDTLWVDGETSGTAVPADVKAGETVAVVHATASTRSIPPQSAAYAVVRGMDSSAQVQPRPDGDEEQPQLPDSLLYYGSLKEITKDKDGSIQQLWFESEAQGEYVMTVNEDTAWIDSPKGTVSDPADLKVGEMAFVFHSPIATLSLPPHSLAYAVVRNTPADAACARYHEIEAVEATDNGVTITTDNGGLYLAVSKDAAVTAYSGAAAKLADLKVGAHIMAWYDGVAESYPGQAGTDQVMILDMPGTAIMTRGGFAALLHEKAGAPQVKYTMTYKDVTDATPNAEAIRWASSEKLLSGYSSGKFGPADTLNREQLVTVLWRYAGSPKAENGDLSQYADAASVSSWAKDAMVWANEQGVLTANAKSQVQPKGTVNRAEARNMLTAVTMPESWNGQ